MNIIKKRILYLLAFILIAVPFPAFSAEPDLVNNPELWFETNNIITEEITDYNNIGGFYSYYSNTENHCIFLYISYNEINLKSENNEIKINFYISNENNSYRFTVNENGVEGSSTVKTAFSVTENFGSISEQGQDIYIGIEFKNKQDIKCNNTLNFSIDVNGNSYDINKIINLYYYDEVSDKTYETSTKSDNQSEKEKTDTSKSTSAKEPSTKFKYIPSDNSNTQTDLWHYENNISEQENNGYDEAISNSSEPNTIITEQKAAVSFSTVSKALLVLAAIMISGGISLILYCLFKPKKTLQPKANENEKETAAKH